MAKPSTLPTWATDANYPADAAPEAGEPTKIAPTSGKQETGFRPDEIPTAEELNHLIGWLCLWAAYVDAGLLEGDVDITGDLTVEGDATFEQDLVANTIHASSNISTDSSIFATSGSVSAGQFYATQNQLARLSREKWFDPDTGSLLPSVKTGSYPLENITRKIVNGSRGAIRFDELPGGAEVNQIALMISSGSVAYTYTITRQGIANATSVANTPHGNPAGGDLRFDSFPEVSEGSAGACMMLLLEASGAADIIVGDVVVRYTMPHP